MDFGNFLLALTPFNLALALFGVVAGTIIGSIPGLTATMAVAVLVPITFSMEPASALILLGAIYTGAIYGGAYAAILLNTPGTPSAIATTFDGYPMAKKGKGDLAVALACFASVFGGMVGALALLFLAPPLSKVALAFGPIEYFWLSIFGLSLIASLSNGNLLKGLIGGAFGMILSTVGVAEISADIRLTFGSQTMIAGFGVVGAMIGLYCIPVLLDLVAVPERHLKIQEGVKSVRIMDAARLALQSKVNLVRSAVIGTLVGILPGAGGSVAGLVAYSEAKRNAKPDQRFGEGEPDGIIATEAANNATVGGGFIPTLVLGIPGTPPDAVILGALLVQGVRTGPTLFESNGSIVYTFIYGLLIATVLMLPAGLLIGRYAYKSIVTIPKAMLVPTVGFMTIVGTYSIRNSLSDVIIMIGLGVFAWLVGNFGFAASPIVLGLILGPIAEQGFVQSWIIGDAINNLPGMFFGQPISQAIIAFTLLSLSYPLIKARQDKKALNEAGINITQAANGERSQRGSQLITALFIVAGVVTIIDTLQYTDIDSMVFPRAAATILILCACLSLVTQLSRGTSKTVFTPGSWWRRALLIISMLLACWLMPMSGFLLAAAAAFAGTLFAAMHEQWATKLLIYYFASGVLIIVGIYTLFKIVLQVPLP